MEDLLDRLSFLNNVVLGLSVKRAQIRILSWLPKIRQSLADMFCFRKISHIEIFLKKTSEIKKSKQQKRNFYCFDF